MKNQSSNIRNSLIIRIFEFSKIGFGSEAEPKNSFSFIPPLPFHYLCLLENNVTIMKESIIIKNLGPLKEVEISDIKPLTVFIGKSASGKSTIMKIIVLMRYIYKW